MVMCEVGLSRIEKLPHTIARELRPALAPSDSAVLFVDRFRHGLVVCGCSAVQSAGSVSWPAAW